jgi:Ca2+-binding EF-hand superfamily protein
MLLTPLILALAAAQAPAVTPPAPAYSSRRGGRLFISPMGEPFRPSSRDDDSLADWFRQADRNHDGQVTLDEMQQDADRFFAILDGNHDGEIDPDEISHYENVVAPEVISGSSYGLMEAADSSEGRSRGHRHAGFIRGSEDQHQGAGRFGLLDLPEPVVSADSNFNRGVSQAEFRAAAAQRFMALDLDHRGYLTLPSLEIIRPAPPAAPNKPERPKDGDESALPDDPGL